MNICHPLNEFELRIIYVDLNITENITEPFIGNVLTFIFTISFI
jgi:hypothetical protein